MNILLLVCQLKTWKRFISVHATIFWNQRLSRHLASRVCAPTLYSTCHPDNVCPREAAWKMSFFSEEIESQCRISRTDLRREEEKEEEQKKRTTRRRRNAVRSHIGSDTSNPEATPRIPPSCWTSCSLHNRIRMNRPSPALVLLFNIFLFHYASLFICLLALFELVFLLSPLFSSVLFLSWRSSRSLLFPLFTCRFTQLPLRVSFLSGDVLAQRIPFDFSFS